MSSCLVLLVSRLFLCCSVVLCAPVVPPEPLKKVPSSIALQFMRQYGYLESGGADAEALYSEVAVEGAVRDVQRFGGIPETGVIDNTTLQLMQSPRCGVPDIIKQRNKRYVLSSGIGWTKRKLTYFIANWTPKIDQFLMKTELQKAFDAWARYARLTFQEVLNPDADIIVAFARGSHGDGFPFDGPGSVLAHAFFPDEMGSYGGDIHFDDDEGWKINPGEFDDGVDFFTVAVHELGHSLGLAHSAMPESIMNPYYRRSSISSSFSLGYDDILGMYELYIKRHLIGDNEDHNTPGSDDNRGEDENRDGGTTDKQTSTAPTPTVESKPNFRPTVTFEGDVESVDDHKNHDKMHKIPGSVPPLTPDMTPTTPSSSSENKSPDGCDGNFDAVAHLREELFIFKDEWLWRLSEPGRITPSYPVKIQRMFHKFPSTIKKIDAAYQRDTDSNIIFFTGDTYWVFNGNDFVENSPRPISDYGIPDYVRHIDAAMIWDKNRKTYIFSGSQYWRYNDTSHTVDPDYPKTITMFRGVPNDLDSAVTWKDGITYFFKDRSYWAFNNTWKKTESEYPKSATKYLLNCLYR